jgi:hypothetical protein
MVKTEVDGLTQSGEPAVRGLDGPDLKRLRPSVPVVMVGMLADGPSVLSDFALPSFNPQQLLELLRELRPNGSEAVQDRDQRLSEEAEFLPNLEVGRN